MSKVPVHDEYGDIVARVEYNSNLDYWDGNNWTCGETGRHLGLTRLKKSGQYVLIHGTQWQGERDSAEIISEREAYEHIVSSDNGRLFDKFPGLLKFEETLDSEEGADDAPTTIQLSKGLKNRLESLKLAPGESYQDLLIRLVPGLAESTE